MNVPLPTDSSRMGGKLSLLIGIRSLSLLRSRCKNTLILGFMICISYDNVSFMLYAWFNYLTSAEESKMKTEGISVWCCFIAQENLNMFKSRVILLAFSEPAKLWLWVRISSSHPRVKLNPSRIGTHTLSSSWDWGSLGFMLWWGRMTMKMRKALKTYPKAVPQKFRNHLCVIPSYEV